MAASQHAFACRDGQWLARGISRRHVEGRRSYLPKPTGSKSRMGDLGGNARTRTRTAFRGAQRIRGEVAVKRNKRKKSGILSQETKKRSPSYISPVAGESAEGAHH